MPALRVIPVFRHGQERLYVSLRDGRSVAWYDRDAGRVSLLHDDDELRQEVLAALAPFVTGDVAVGPPPVPTAAELARLSLHPDDDLAPNRPGEALHTELERFAPRHRYRHDPRRDELAAQQAVGAELERLEGAGWRVLHSVPLPGDGDISRIDHVLIGPAGVMTVRTLHARRQRVLIADPMVRAGRGEPTPELRWARRQAERASLALAAAVVPGLALYGAARVDIVPSFRDVRILRDDAADELTRLGGVLKPADIEGLYAVARDRGTWLRV
ncbi:NERD domain-containing protein [Streptomyces sannanensis]|uniref:NERD domain-containing protein n=1 Tax=Streptomyces sannanensis TaxID=285536 RepID=A0ABP6SFE7_9ACTN